MEKEISKATVARMPLYLHYLQEENSKGRIYISSADILLQRRLIFLSRTFSNLKITVFIWVEKPESKACLK